MKNPWILNLLAVVLVVLGLLSQRQGDVALDLAQEFVDFTNEAVPIPSSATNAGVNATAASYLVEKVVDGDTIKVRMTDGVMTVRLVGINTPESVDPRKEVECFGQEAAEKLRTVLVGQRVTLQSDATQADRDRYGRLLRFVFLDGQDVGLWLLTEGYARESLYSDTPHIYRAAYVAAEQSAQAAMRGLWAMDVCEW